jgi:type VI secretion system protein ImpH
VAGKVRESSVDLKERLLKKGHEYSFYQVMRLLRLLMLERKVSPERDVSEEGKIRIRPELTLAFPASDITRIEESEDKDYSFLIGASFLGLYGPSSPLPTFYTEDLLDEAGEDISVTRDFLDMINQRLFFLLYHCRTKYRQFLQIVEEKNPEDLEKLFCLLGLGEKELRKDIDSYPLIRYTGLFTQFPRSATGLEALLKDTLGGMAIEVVPCIKRRVRIPSEQRLHLGESNNILGEDSYIGEEIDDRMGKFRLKIGPLKSEQFHSLLPGNTAHGKLVFLTRFYLVDPLEYDLELVLAEAEAGSVCLGASKWARLGMDTWVFSGQAMGEGRCTFPPHYS